MSSTPIEGMEVPVHRSLVAPILLGGAPRGLAILAGTLAAALGLGLQQWIAGLVVWLVGHSLLAFAARRDPDFTPILARHLRQAAQYSC